MLKETIHPNQTIDLACFHVFRIWIKNKMIKTFLIFEVGTISRIPAATCNFDTSPYFVLVVVIQLISPFDFVVCP